MEVAEVAAEPTEVVAPVEPVAEPRFVLEEADLSGAVYDDPADKPESTDDVPAGDAEKPAAEESNDEFSADLRSRAEAFGVPADLIGTKYATAVELENALDLAASVMIQTDRKAADTAAPVAAEVPKPATPATQAPTPAAVSIPAAVPLPEFKLTVDDLDEGPLSLMKAHHDALASVTAKLPELEKVAVLEQQLAELKKVADEFHQERQAEAGRHFAAQFDAELAQLGPEWEAVLGKGAVHEIDPTSPAMKSREAVLEHIYDLRNSMMQRGKEPLPLKDGVAMALRALHPNVFQQQANAAVSKRLKAQPTAVAKPGPRNTASTNGEPSGSRQFPKEVRDWAARHNKTLD